MEKLQPILSGLKKHHFWIVCVLAIGMVLAGWYMALDEIPPQFQKNKSAVSLLFQTAGDISGNTKLAGDAWPEEAEKKGRELHESLTTAARKFMQGHEVDRSKKSTPEALEKYQKIAPREFDQLRDQKGVGKVQWDEAQLKQLRGQFEFPAVPTADAMHDAQEKLAVIRFVLSSIAGMNENAPDELNLPVSAIEVFQVGPAAQARPPRFVEGLAPPPPPTPAPAAAPAPGAAPPAPAKAPPKPPVRKGPAVPAPAPPPPPPTVALRPATGLRPYPVRLRVKMNPDLVGRLMGHLLANQRVNLIVDDVLISNETRTRAGIAPAAAPAPAPPAAAVPGAAPGAPARPNAAPPGARPRGARPVPPPVPGGAPAAVPGAPAPAGAAPGEPAPEEPAAPLAPEKPPHLVQVPRGSVVEIQATAYFADLSQVEALKAK